MEFVSKIILILVAIFIGTFLAPLLGILGGVISGWVASLFFDETFYEIFSVFGIEGVPLWKIGAFLGFISGFAKAILVNDK